MPHRFSFGGVYLEFASIVEITNTPRRNPTALIPAENRCPDLVIHWTIHQYMIHIFLYKQTQRASIDVNHSLPLKVSMVRMLPRNMSQPKISTLGGALDYHKKSHYPKHVVMLERPSTKKATVNTPSLEGCTCYILAFLRDEYIS